MVKRNYKKCIMGLSVLIILYVVLVITCAAYYSVYSADDFWTANSVGVFHAPFMEHLLASFRFTKRMYFEWQGTYTSMFLEAFLTPLNTFGLTWLRIVMCLNSLLFFGTLTYMLMTFCCWKAERNNCLKWFVCACFVFQIMNYKANPEMFFWFTGAMAYTTPLSFLFLALTFFRIKDEVESNREKNIFTLLSAAFGIAAMGGALMISGLGCYCILLLCLFSFMKRKKISIRNCIIAFSFFVGALVNAIAPGNFVRHEEVESGIHLFSAIFRTCRRCMLEVYGLFSEKSLYIYFLIFIVCGMYLYDKVHDGVKEYTAVSILALITPLVAVFPVELGYGAGSAMYFPNRCLFVTDFAIAMVSMNLALLMGYWIMAYFGSGGGANSRERSAGDFGDNYCNSVL